MKNEKGMVMVLGLMLLTVLTIMGISAVSMVIFDTKISANYDVANQAFYTADSGVEDACSKIRNTGTPPPIVDNEPENPNWKVVIGTAERADQKGLSGVTRIDRLEPSLDYFVTITHKVNSSDVTLKWGDANGDGLPEENTTQGANIYVVTSEGRSKEGSSRTLQAEVVKSSIIVPAAIYTKADTKIQGTSTKILGSDACGTTGKPGIVTMGAITTSGNPTVTGSPTGEVQNSTQDVDINSIISSLKSGANYTYDVPGGTNMSGANWGTPFVVSQDEPSTCGVKNIVYFNAHGSTVKLTGGSSGCGVLMIDGNLEANGGFNWNGLILVTGSVTFLGGGNKNITGGVMSNSKVDSDTIGGNITIIYCSTAVKNQTDDLPSVLLNWKD
ncbi:MAG: pilus assembly PilX N-terminal domain-containing protein [Nanoarchaeota archaeon]|nr:pilus assembly PilX N-terminal domain-containing protein [Nanoarchaeota archaeon]